MTKAELVDALRPVSVVRRAPAPRRPPRGAHAVPHRCRERVDDRTAVAATLEDFGAAGEERIRHPFVAVDAVPRMEGSPDRLGLAALGLPRRRGGGLLSFAVLCHSLQIDAISVVSGVSRLLRQHDFDR